MIQNHSVSYIYERRIAGATLLLKSRHLVIAIGVWSTAYTGLANTRALSLVRTCLA
ncbi:hypothetical protein BURKHO8Y_540002 [Burkholderia sp. 8Y]|nr:hypothetical protein BURKHO8Y_540002 [Burkholderia sp. 8Y]